MAMRLATITSMFCLLALTVLCMAVGEARADGGIIQMAKIADPFNITVYTTTTPLRVGPADLSVLIQNRGDSEPVLGAQVRIRLQNEKGLQVTAQATHAIAQNKLLYAAKVNIPEAGQWEIEVRVQQGEQIVNVSETIAVAPSRSMLLSHWQNLALPPLIISLFVLNQWLKRRYQKFN